MTMPVLIENHKEKVTVNKVKKMYSVISQALLSAISEYGTLNEWDVPDVNSKESIEKFMPYLKPYLLISKDCGTKSGCLKYKQPPLYLSGQRHNINYDVASIYYKLILNDGTYIWLRTSMSEYCKATDAGVKNTCGVIWIDINGGEPPNTIGKDIFTFMLLKDRISSPDPSLCKITEQGWACGGYILKNGNMDYLHEKTGN